MKVVVDLDTYKPNENDILIFNGKHFTLINKCEFMELQDNKIVELNKEVENLSNVVKDLTSKINMIAKATKTILGD